MKFRFAILAIAATALFTAPAQAMSEQTAIVAAATQITALPDFSLCKVKSTGQPQLGLMTQGSALLNVRYHGRGAPVASDIG